MTPQNKEIARQLLEAAVFAAGGVLLPAVIGLLTSPASPTWDQIHLIIRMSLAAGLIPVAAYFKNKARVVEAHLPELGSRGDRHDDAPPPPPPVVAVAKAAVEAMKDNPEATAQAQALMTPTVVAPFARRVDGGE